MTGQARAQSDDQLQVLLNNDPVFDSTGKILSRDDILHESKTNQLYKDLGTEC